MLQKKKKYWVSVENIVPSCLLFCQRPGSQLSLADRGNLSVRLAVFCHQRTECVPAPAHAVRYTFSNSVNIPSRFASFPFCVSAEKKSGVHTQPWLRKWETNRAARTEPPTRSHSQVVKYWRLVTTRARAQDNSDAVRYSSEFQGALTGGVYLFGCWVQITTKFLQDCRLHL